MGKNFYDEKWREGGVCRPVCRPVRTTRRCFNAAKVKSVVTYAIKCGETREAIDDALGCVSCQDVISVLKQVQGIKGAAQDSIATMQGVLEAFAVVASILRLVPTWIRRFPVIRRFFFAVEALLAFADVVSSAIGNLIDSLIKIEALILALAEDVCNGEDGITEIAGTTGEAEAAS